MAAEICLTHSFPNKNIGEYQGTIDIEADDLLELKLALQKTDYGYFHKLIILCDGYGFVDGFISLEKRWIDAAIRIGINEYTIEKWKSMYKLRDEINLKYSINIENIIGIKN